MLVSTRSRRHVFAANLALAALLFVVRPAHAQPARFHLVNTQTGAAAAPELADESTFVLGTAAMIAAAGRLPPAESRSVVPAMRAAYARLQRDEGSVPSPWTSALPGPMLVIEPRQTSESHVGLVFLHGAGGNFAVQCSWLARAGEAANARTVCPSAGPDARWTSPADRAEVGRGVAYLRARGATQIYVDGLSNGAIGLSRLAPALARDVDGFVLISGAATSARPTRRPTLIVQSRDDHMTPPRVARRYARGAGPALHYVELEGTHFMFAERTDEVCRLIGDWLAALRS